MKVKRESGDDGESRSKMMWRGEERWKCCCWEGKKRVG